MSKTQLHTPSVRGTSPSQIRIGQAVLGERGKRRDRVSPIRKLEIELLLRARRGQRPLDMGTEELFLLAITRHLIALAEEGQGPEAVIAWCRAKCPKLSARRGGKWLAAFAASAPHHPFYSAQVIGNLLALTPQERTVLGITTIWAAGWTKADYEAHRRSSKASTERKRRAKLGSIPRTLSIEALAPWEAEGLSRAKWYSSHPKPERDAILRRLRQIRGHQSEPYGSVITTKGGHKSVSPKGGSTQGVTPPAPLKGVGGRCHDASPSDCQPLGPLRRAAYDHAQRRAPSTSNDPSTSMRPIRARLERVRSSDLGGGADA